MCDIDTLCLYMYNVYVITYDYCYNTEVRTLRQVNYFTSVLMVVVPSSSIVELSMVTLYTRLPNSMLISKESTESHIQIPTASAQSSNVSNEYIHLTLEGKLISNL